MTVYGLLAVVLQTTWLVNFPSHFIQFDFIVIAVAALAFNFEWRKAVPVILAYGLMMDIASEAPVGMSIISYLAAYGFIRAIIFKISFQGGLALTFWIGLVSLIDKFVSAFIFFISRGSTALSLVMIERAPAQAVVDAVLGLGLIPFLSWYWNLSLEKLSRPKGIVLK